MQVPSLDAALLTASPASGSTIVRLLAGDLTAFKVGTLVQATVTATGPNQLTLDIGGQPLSVRLPAAPTSAALVPGTVIAVRIPPPGAATLEIAGVISPQTAPTPSSPTPTTTPAATPSPPTPLTMAATVATPTTSATPTPTSASAPTTASAPKTASALTAAPATTPTPLPLTVPQFASRVATADVLAVLPDGRVRVQMNGNEEVATSATPLETGGRYIVQVERTQTGLTIRPIPDAPHLTADVAAAVLRSFGGSDLAVTVKPLLAELTTLQNSDHPSVRDAAATLRDTLRALLPGESHSPTATGISTLVKDGGLHFEAKLARLVEQQFPIAPDGRTTNTPARAAVEGDLKGDLLRLLRAVQDFGAAPVPAARATLEGIESQQAANALAQTNGTAYLLQVPFPDGGTWQTLRLALEPENRGDQADTGRSDGGYRLLMHVPLSGLGETWVDAGLGGNRFRAVLYLEHAGTRDQVRAELSGLRDELLNDGFDEVLLDVRATSDLPAARRQQGSALRAGRPETVSVIDVRV